MLHRVPGASGTQRARLIRNFQKPSMKPQLKLLALVLFPLGIVLMLSGINHEAWLPAMLADWSPVSITLGSLFLFLALLITWGSQKSNITPRTLFSLDSFLPFLRKKKKKETLTPDAWPLGLMKRVLPDSLFADRERGKPGGFRKLFKRIGPSLLSAPVRRSIQTICFAIFVWLFFYVCWPYGAKPAEPGPISSNWKMEQIDQATGDVHFNNPGYEAWLPTAGSTIYLIDSSQARPPDAFAGEYQVQSSDNINLILTASPSQTDDQFDLLLTGSGPWALHQLEPNAWPSHYTDHLAAKEKLPADLFLTIDPLVSLSTAIASRSWVWSLVSAAVILLVCVVIPRGFCGYLCPLGTLIDLFDWSITGRTKRFQLPDDGWWVHIKYYLLAITLGCAACGVLISGFVAAIPVITRGMLLIGDPIQTSMLRGTHLVPPMHWGHLFSIGLFLTVLCLGFLRPRFWCKYVCPSGAVFSLGNLFRISERKVESSCINCNKCIEICPFDAIKPDFTTRTTDCTMCQTCGGVCPTHAIKFVERWNTVELKVLNDPPTEETAIGRRGFLSLAAGSAATLLGTAAAVGVTNSYGAKLDDPNALRPVRPPGSVPEQEFLQMCIRCGECFKACPNNVLQLEGFQQGLEGLWTPLVNADWAGCESSCNACGQICPTGAIRALPLEEKQVARMGLAIVDQQPACLLPEKKRVSCASTNVLPQVTTPSNSSKCIPKSMNLATLSKAPVF